MIFPEYLEKMQTFKRARGSIVKEGDDRFPYLIKEWAEFLREQHRNGLISLFLTGSGVSANVVPNLETIIQELKNIYLENPARQGSNR
jgi:hypothetical protein